MSHLTLFCSVALKRPLATDLLPSFTNRTGVTVDAVFAPSGPLLERISSEQAFDVVVMMSGALAEVADDGDVIGSTIEPVASARMGIAAPSRGTLPDVSSAGSLVAALISARSVAYSRAGASGIAFAGLLERLGIAATVNRRATVIDAGFTAEALEDGRADLAVQQLSELACVPGVKVAPFPEELQHVTQFSAAVSTHSTRRASAVGLVEFLVGTTARRAYAAASLDEPARRGPARPQ